LGTNTLETSFDLLWATPSRTPFERNVLPGLAQWFLEKLDRERPDLLLPVQTKGARALERVLDYIRQELGAPVRVPLLYSPALAYVSPEELASRKVLLVDDAVRTGRSLARHSRYVMEYGAVSVQAVAWIGHAGLAKAGGAHGNGEKPGAELGPVSCYRWVNTDMYREYVWQLAELVVARGLPPEVDHHVFELCFAGRLADFWPSLAQAVAPYGTLTADGPLTSQEEIVSMTLHFPRFPDTPKYPLVGTVRDGGIRKVRLFADIPAKTIHVVPITFPALDLPAGTGDVLSRELCRDVLRRWTGARETIGTTLIDAAKTRRPEMLFRTLSTVAEVDLMRGLRSALARADVSSELSIRTQREVFGRLYGARIGSRVADLIDGELATRPAEQTYPDSIAAGEALNGSPPGAWDDDQPSHGLTAEVVAGTQRIAKFMKLLYDKRASEANFNPDERVGLAFGEIGRRVPPHKPNLLLTSQCIDYGLAMTTLVPYTDVKAEPDGSRTVLRKFRVSEILRGDEPYADVDAIRRELDEATIALIARYLALFSTRYHDRAIPEDELARIVSILRPAILATLGLTLRTRPSEDGPELVVGSLARPGSIYDSSSLYFVLESDGIRPSRNFEDWYRTDTKLRIDLRGDSDRIENHLANLVTIIDEAEDTGALLLRWSMSADGKLGLTHVHHPLTRAIHALEQPMKEIVRGSTPDAAGLLQARDDARRLAQLGVNNAGALATDWAHAIRERLASRRDKREIGLLRSLATPTDGRQLYELSATLCQLVDAAACLLAPLAAWAAQETDSGALPPELSEDVALELATPLRSVIA
jgi:hypothetical protein